jgi:hypothetical protein
VYDPTGKTGLERRRVPGRGEEGTMGWGGAERRLALVGTVAAVAAPAVGSVQQEVRDPTDQAQAPVPTDPGTVFTRPDRWTCPVEAENRFRECVAAVWAEARERALTLQPDDSASVAAVRRLREAASGAPYGGDPVPHPSARALT